MCLESAHLHSCSSLLSANLGVNELPPPPPPSPPCLYLLPSSSCYSPSLSHPPLHSFSIPLQFSPSHFSNLSSSTSLSFLFSILSIPSCSLPPSFLLFSSVPPFSYALFSFLLFLFFLSSLIPYVLFLCFLPPLFPSVFLLFSFPLIFLLFFSVSSLPSPGQTEVLCSMGSGNTRQDS